MFGTGLLCQEEQEGEWEESGDLHVDEELQFSH